MIDAGLGGMANNFDTISFHTWPNPRPAEELWPDLDAKEKAKLAEHLERVAREHPGYAGLDGDECGRRELAGKSVAVPFVGTAAASLVVAEAVRLLHDGPAYFDIKLSLGNPGKRSSRANGCYSALDTAGVSFVESRKL